MQEKVSWVQRYLDEWVHRCPECSSTDVDELDIYKGFTKKGKQRKYKCKSCKEEYWVEI